MIKPPRKPCSSCPYVTTTPSGIWDETEYAKLPAYDLPTPYQPISVFMCHQRDGCLCGGWLITHNTDHLLALRIARNLDHETIQNYNPPNITCFSSGQEACDHGVRDVDNPSPQAKRKISCINRKRLLK